MWLKGTKMVTIFQKQLCDTTVKTQIGMSLHPIRVPVFEFQLHLQLQLPVSCVFSSIRVFVHYVGDLA